LVARSPSPKDGVRWDVIRSDIRTFFARLPGLFRNDYSAVMLALDLIGPFAEHGMLAPDDGEARGPSAPSESA